MADCMNRHAGKVYYTNLGLVNITMINTITIYDKKRPSKSQSIVITIKLKMS